MMPSEFERDDFFDSKNRSNVRGLVKSVIRANAEGGSGVVPTGGGREKKGENICLGILFRAGLSKGASSGNREMEVGRRELMMELSPGEIPPTLLKARIVKGKKINDKHQEALARIFLEVKEEGFFEESYARALSEIVRRFSLSVIAFKESLSS